MCNDLHVLFICSQLLLKIAEKRLKMVKTRKLHQKCLKQHSSTRSEIFSSPVSKLPFSYGLHLIKREINKNLVKKM